MATETLKFPNIHHRKPKLNLPTWFNGRKRARKSKPPQGIAIKKTKEDDHDHDHRKIKKIRLDMSSDVISCPTNVKDQYETLNEISRGAYGVVFRACDRETGEIVAIKEELNGLSTTTLREIDILKFLGGHPRIVRFEKVARDDHDSVYVVMEYFENDLGRYIDNSAKNKPFSPNEVKCLMKQLLEGVEFLHHNGVMHRDLKPSNILINGSRKLKICDFGLSRRFRSGFGSGSESGSYTPLVVTLWYRAPELLLGANTYSSAIDMWSVGCIMAELLLKEALFPGESEIGQIKKIYGILDMPIGNVWSGYDRLRDKIPADVLTKAGFDLLKKLLAYDPDERISAEAALNHEWFKEY